MFHECWFCAWGWPSRSTSRASACAATWPVAIAYSARPYRSPRVCKLRYRERINSSSSFAFRKSAAWPRSLVPRVRIGQLSALPLVCTNATPLVHTSAGRQTCLQTQHRCDRCGGLSHPGEGSSICWTPHCGQNSTMSITGVVMVHPLNPGQDLEL